MINEESKMRRFLTITSLIVIQLTAIVGCSQKTADRSTTATNKAADIVFTNRYIYTFNDKQPETEVVAVDGNKIVYVGDEKGAKSFINKDTKVIDLNGKMLLPGFVSKPQSPHQLCVKETVILFAYIKTRGINYDNL